MSTVHYTHYAEKLNEIAYKPQSKNSKGGVIVYFRPNDHTATNMRFQLQDMNGIKCKAPFGVSCFDESKGARKSIELSIEDEDLVKFFQSFDEHNIAAAIANKDWFKNSTITDDQIRAMYYPMLGFDQTGKGYSPRLHTKINTDGPRGVNVLLYTEKNGNPKYEPGTTDDIERYAECMVIVEATGLWFQSKQFGMSLLATDVYVFPKSKRKEFEFLWGANAPTKVQAHHQEPEDLVSAASIDDLSTSVLLLPGSIDDGVTLVESNPKAKKHKAK
jgi:hypothetical protein